MSSLTNSPKYLCLAKSIRSLLLKNSFHWRHNLDGVLGFFGGLPGLFLVELDFFFLETRDRSLGSCHTSFKFPLIMWVRIPSSLSSSSLSLEFVMM
jgi:hypothetical protein